MGLWLPGTSRGGNEGNMYRVSVWGDETVLVLDSGDGCTIYISIKLLKYFIKYTKTKCINTKLQLALKHMFELC